MNRSVDAVLFDADGVIQLPSRERRTIWRDRLGPEADLDAFVRDIFVAEAPALTGDGDFSAGLAKMLGGWSWRGTANDLVDTWALIEVVPEMLDRIRILRDSGMTCHLASDQEPNRARQMSEALGYRKLFEREFYSCHMGVVKRDPAYFEMILSELRLAPDRVLFLDDRASNLDSARSLGLQVEHFDLSERQPSDLDAILEAYVP